MMNTIRYILLSLSVVWVVLLSACAQHGTVAGKDCPPKYVWDDYSQSCKYDG